MRSFRQRIAPRGKPLPKPEKLELAQRRGGRGENRFSFSLHGDLCASPPVLTTETLRHSVAGRDQISPRKTKENEEPQSDTDQHRSGSFLWLCPSVFICGLASCLLDLWAWKWRAIRRSASSAFGELGGEGGQPGQRKKSTLTKARQGCRAKPQKLNV